MNKKKIIIIVSIVCLSLVIIAGACILLLTNQKKTTKQQEVNKKIENNIKDDTSKEVVVTGNDDLEEVDKEYINNAIKYEYAGVSVYLPNGYILSKELKTGAQYSCVDNKNQFIYTLTDATKEETIAKNEYQNLISKKYPKISGPSGKIINNIKYDIYVAPYNNYLDIYCAYGFKDKKVINCIYYNFKNEELNIEDILKSLVIE